MAQCPFQAFYSNWKVTISIFNGWPVGRWDPKFLRDFVTKKSKCVNRMMNEWNCFLSVAQTRPWGRQIVNSKRMTTKKKMRIFWHIFNIEIERRKQIKSCIKGPWGTYKIWKGKGAKRVCKSLNTSPKNIRFSPYQFRYSWFDATLGHSNRSNNHSC